MRLVEVRLTNFRGFRGETTVRVDDLTALIGKNDAGKSTILEALEAVLAKGKVDPSDIHVGARSGENVVIECAFDELPASVVLDAESETTFQQEYLCDERGCLRLRWAWTIGGDPGSSRRLTSAKVPLAAIAHHPVSQGVAGLVTMKNEALKRRVTDAGLSALCGLSDNVSMRKALWEHAAQRKELVCETIEVDLAPSGGRSLKEGIIAALPMFVLFRADRSSTDQDSEAQEPLKVAVQVALQNVQREIDEIIRRVEAEATEVATRTLEKLREFDPALASTLRPNFRADPKWESVFKLGLEGDDGIAINKRGSGVRRLVLFSFFRAEVERLQRGGGKANVVYAVEEPETAQHPGHQRKMFEALDALSREEGCQVLLTTHVPALAALLPTESLRLVESGADGAVVHDGTEDVVRRVAETLGVLPDRAATANELRLLVCVEGGHDIAFLRAISGVLRQAEGDRFPCLATDPRVTFVPLGGSSLQEWVNGDYLGKLGVTEYHLYDRDLRRDDGKFTHEEHAAKVNARGRRDSARLTLKREMENYIHPQAIDRIFEPLLGYKLCLEIADETDVCAAITAKALDENGKPRRRLERRDWKSWLNREVAAAMTVEELDECDGNREVRGWLTEIAALLGEDSTRGVASNRAEVR